MVVAYDDSLWRIAMNAAHNHVLCAFLLLRLPPRHHLVLGMASIE